MSTPLSKAQLHDFEDRLQRLGITLPPSARSIEVSEEGHLTPVAHVTLASVAEMKTRMGVRDADIEAGAISDHWVPYPPPPAPALLAAQTHDELSPTDRTHLAQARLAFIQGHSARVKAYEGAINHLHFPMQVAVYAAQNITVSAGNTLVIASSHPIAIHFGVVTVSSGGQIIVRGTPLTWTSSQLTQPGAAAAAPTISFVSNPGQGQGATGLGGSPAPVPFGWGVKGIIIKPTHGGTGHPGGQGPAAAPIPSSTLNLGTCSGSIQITAAPGKGGRGGTGGLGGSGKGKSGNLSMKGGRGGTGGQGGPGGNGSDIYVLYSGSKPSFSYAVGPGGDGGDPGQPGVGHGNLGPGHQGTPGPDGAPGHFKPHAV